MMYRSMVGFGLLANVEKIEMGLYKMPIGCVGFFSERGGIGMMLAIFHKCGMMLAIFHKCGMMLVSGTSV